MSKASSLLSHGCSNHGGREISLDSFGGSDISSPPKLY